MAKYILKRKSFTKYDETDNLKRLKDSDILAEKKKKTTNYGNIASSAVIGAGVGGLAGGAAGLLKGGKGLAARGKAAKLLGKNGAYIGAGIGAGISYVAGRKKAKENKEYNNRLKYAQRQALRRERKDWVTNMTQRDGYSY